MPPAAGVLNLSEQAAIFTLHRFSPALEPVNHAVVPGNYTVVALVRGNHQRLSDHHRSAALGSVGVIMNLTILDAVLSAEVWRNRGMNNAVLECLARQSERRKKIWIGFVTIHWVDFLRLGELRQAFRNQFFENKL